MSCSICSKFAKKMLECALPVTVPAQGNPFDAFLDSADGCLTTAWDRVLYEYVHGGGATLTLYAWVNAWRRQTTNRPSSPVTMIQHVHRVCELQQP